MTVKGTTINEKKLDGVYQREEFCRILKNTMFGVRRQVSMGK